MFLLALIPLLAAADLPAESVRYKVDVEGTVGDVHVNATFRNDTDHVIAGTYTFLLPEGASVDQLRITIGSRVIEGMIKENAVADRMYADARAAGRVGAGTTLDRTQFRQHLANIGPGETIEVQLGVVEPVGELAEGPSTGAQELALALSPGPRFDLDDRPDSRPDLANAEYLKPRSQPATTVDLDVHAAVPIVRAESPAVAADLQIEGEHLTASLQNVPADKDFVLRWWTAGATPQFGMLVAGEHALLTFVPPATSSYSERVPRELVWVVDTSWNVGSKLDEVKLAMKAALDQMGRDDSFAIYTVDPKVRPAFRKPLDGRPSHVQRARRVIKRLELGGAPTVDAAVLAALALPTDPARHRVVCVLSSASLLDADEVIKQLAAHPEITLSTAGIGTDSAALENLASLGGGVAVHTAWGEKPETAPPRLLAAMDRPVLTELQVDWGAWQVESMYPTRIPDLQAGAEQIVAIHLAGGSGPVRVTGRSGTGSFAEVVDPIRVGDARPLVTTWARRRIREIERRKALGELADPKPEIQDTALRWQLDTDYSQLVAVETGPDGWEFVSEARLEHDFLSRIPVGRTYDTWPKPVSVWEGSYSLNFNFDAMRGLRSAGDQVELPTLGSHMLAGDFDERLSSQDALGGAAGGWSTLSSNAQTLGLWGEAGGHLIADKLGASASVDFDDAHVPGASATSNTLALRLVAQASSLHRLTLDLDTDPTYATVATTTSRYGGKRGTLRWNWFLNKDTNQVTEGTALDRTVRGDQRRAFEIFSQLNMKNIRAAGSHDLGASVGLEYFDWASAESTGSATLASVAQEDRWALGPVDLDAKLAAGVLVSDRAHFLPSPGLLVRWAPFGSYQTRLRLAGSRNWDAASLAIGAVDGAGLPGRVDSATLAVDQALFSNFILAVEATGRLEHTAFLPRPDWVEVDDVPGSPWVDRTLWQFDVNISREFVKRWNAGVTWRERLPGDPDPALLASPRAFWVDGFLDAYRPHALDAYIWWDIPDDPGTTTLAAYGAWAAAVSPGVPSRDAWWLQPRTRVGLEVRQQVPLRKGSLYVEARGTLALRDLNETFLPWAVLAVEPGVPTLDEQPPFSGYAGVHAEF